MADLKLLKVILLKGKVELLTGLHIGSGSSGVEIGGMDNPVIKHPFTGEPYIPGSSLKGKMRSLMEYDLDKISNDNVHSCDRHDCMICRVFGSTKQPEEVRGPTRIAVRDACLTREWIEKSKEKKIIEEKFENSIDRTTGTAKNPRQIERVASGVEFDFEISYSIFDTGDGGNMDRKYFKDVVLKSLEILEKDRLGGYGSRGSGKIRFKDLFDGETDPCKDLAEYMKNEKISRKN